MVEVFRNPKKFIWSLAVIVLFIFLISPLFTGNADSILGMFSETPASVSIKENSSISTTDPVDTPRKKNGATNEPPIIANNAIVIDRNSYTSLYSKNADDHALPASTTKLTTALVARRIYDLDETITVPAVVPAQIGGSTMGLKAGDVLTLHDLLWGMLLNSGNDAAYTIAFAHPDGLQGFVDDMNALVSDLHLTNTVFTNPAGFDSYEHYTSAHDLAVITDYALKDRILSEIVKTQTKTVTSLTNPPNVYELENTNALLGTVKGITGAKTGWTDAAQGVLTTAVTRNGHEIITVVMHSANRESDTKTLIEWVYNNYEW